jgi:hypothetical protein
MRAQDEPASTEAQHDEEATEACSSQTQNDESQEEMIVHPRSDPQSVKKVSKKANSFHAIVNRRTK